MKTKFLVNSILLLLALIGVQAYAQTSELKVWGDDLTMVADGKTKTTMVISETDNIDFCMLNMSIIVPEGISIAKVRDGRREVNDIFINENRKGDHTIACNMPDPTTIKVMLSSPTLFPLYPDDVDGNPQTELFRIGLIADPSMVNGEYEIQIIDSKFVPVDGKTRIPQEPITFKMTVTGGVDDVTVTSNLGSTGFGTLILPFDSDIPQGIEAYACNNVINGVVQTEKQAKITANMPLLIKGVPGSYKFKGKPTSSTQESYTYGVLTGVFKATTITSGYVLQEQNGIVGFYPVNAAKPINVPSNRCYLQYSNQLKSIRFNGDLTNIEDVYTDGKYNGKMYNIQGKKVNKAKESGVYIIGDKKILLK